MAANDNSKNNILDVKAWSELAEIIHFIRTPIAAIKMGGEILKEYLPIIGESYKNSGNQTSSENVIDDQKIDKLYAIINNILIEAHRISDYIKKVEDNKPVKL